MIKKKYLAIAIFFDENDWEYHKELFCDTLDEVEDFFKYHQTDPNFSHTAIEIN